MACDSIARHNKSSNLWWKQTEYHSATEYISNPIVLAYISLPDIPLTSFGKYFAHILYCERTRANTHTMIQINIVIDYATFASFVFPPEFPGRVACSACEWMSVCLYLSPVFRAITVNRNCLFGDVLKSLHCLRIQCLHRILFRCALWHTLAVYFSIEMPKMWSTCSGISNGLEGCCCEWKCLMEFVLINRQSMESYCLFCCVFAHGFGDCYEIGVFHFWDYFVMMSLPPPALTSLSLLVQPVCSRLFIHWIWPY